MREIRLTPWDIALVDDEDFAMLDQYRWNRVPDRRQVYARMTRPPHTLMHRLLMDASPTEMVDHVNGDGLDNRRSNLRFATRSQNGANSAGHCDRKSPYKGVVQRTDSRYIAYCGGVGNRYLGTFPTAELAARAYDAAAVDRFGEYAKTNFERE